MVNGTYNAGSSQYDGKAEATNQEAHGQKYRQINIRWSEHCRLHGSLHDQRWYDR